ncbi:MAG: DUF4350 domain-containing protein [Thermoguttaceae bacterium]
MAQKSIFPMQKQQMPVGIFRPTRKIVSTIGLTLLFFQISFAVLLAEDVNQNINQSSETTNSEKKPFRILLDVIHANDYSDVGLRDGDYEYHKISGFRNGFEFLKSQGAEITRLNEGIISEKTLEKCDLLFINLVSAEKQPFLVSEINAIVKFVENGGSILIITDHSNCYFHSHILQPLLTELDIQSTRDTACDRTGNTLSSGNGWLKISRFEKHPLTDGTRFLGIQTGGSVDPRFAVAWTSDVAWSDDWYCTPYIEDVSSGFYGNFTPDPEEPVGRLGVVLAKNFGKGRIVIIADQNMLSDTFLNYADNYRLWLNTISWLLQDESLKNPIPYLNWQVEKPPIWVVENFEQPLFGSDDQNGLYNTWVVLNRNFWPFAYDRLPPISQPGNNQDKEKDKTKNNKTGSVSAKKFEPVYVIIPDGYAEHAEETVNDLVAHLKKGKNILVLHTDQDVLLRPKSVVCKIIAKLDQKPDKVKAEKNGDLQSIKLPNCGSIDLFGGLVLFDNLKIPSPTSLPTGEEQKRIERLLNAIKK